MFDEHMNRRIQNSLYAYTALDRVSLRGNAGSFVAFHMENTLANKVGSVVFIIANAATVVNTRVRDKGKFFSLSLKMYSFCVAPDAK